MATPTISSGYQWPGGIPSWQKDSLNTLSKSNKLYGIPPQLLGRIDYWTSDYGNQGLAINPSGYGGYFGESASASYQTPKGIVQSPTATKLTTKSSFSTQAVVSSGVVAEGLQQSTGTITKALARYATGKDTATAIKSSKNFIDWVLGKTSGSATLASATHSTASPKQSTKLKGAAAILKGIDDFLNPSGSSNILTSLTGLSTLEKVVLLSVDRGIAALLFAGIGIVGVVAIVNRRNAGGGVSGLVRLGQSQQRIAAGREARELSGQRLAHSESQSEIGNQFRSQSIILAGRRQTHREQQNRANNLLRQLQITAATQHSQRTTAQRSEAARLRHEAAVRASEQRAEAARLRHEAATQTNRVRRYGAATQRAHEERIAGRPVRNRGPRL